MVVKTYYKLIELNICNYLFDYWLLFGRFSLFFLVHTLQFGSESKCMSYEQWVYETISISLSLYCVYRFLCLCYIVWVLCWTGLKLLVCKVRKPQCIYTKTQTKIIQFNMSSADSVLPNAYNRNMLKYSNTDVSQVKITNTKYRHTTQPTNKHTNEWMNERTKKTANSKKRSEREIRFKSNGSFSNDMCNVVLAI